MNDNAVLFPMLALVGWTFMVLMLIPLKRFGAARKRQVTAEDFKFGESKNVPPEVSIPNRNYMNLLEIPLLFHVVCLTLYLTKTADALALSLAWAYVALRVAHSLVHLSYNQVYHRLTLFAVSNFVLVTIWLRLLLALR